MHVQAQVNEEFHRRFRQREEMDPLYYELVHNLVLEVTRLGIEVQNMKMRVESLSSRMDFDERRGRALESVVQYRPGTTGTAVTAGSTSTSSSAAPPPAAAGTSGTAGAPGATQTGGPRPDGEGRRRRRRRRRRRPGHTMGDQPHAQGAGPSPMRSEGNGQQAPPASPSDDFDDADGDGGDDGGFDGGDEGPDDGAPNQ
jgi:hypothetical protein